MGPGLEQCPPCTCIGWVLLGASPVNVYCTCRVCAFGSYFTCPEPTGTCSSGADALSPLTGVEVGPGVAVPPEGDGVPVPGVLGVPVPGVPVPGVPVPGVPGVGVLVATSGLPKMMAVHPLRASAAMSPTMGSVSLPAFMESSYELTS